MRTYTVVLDPHPEERRPEPQFLCASRARLALPWPVPCSAGPALPNGASLLARDCHPPLLPSAVCHFQRMSAASWQRYLLDSMPMKPPRCR
jgi:hypothetical protein